MITIDNGELIIDDVVLKNNYLYFYKEISRGANGIVFLALDTILERKVAFKIWLKLKPNELRDKKKQGALEAKKQWDAKETVSKWHDEKLENPYFIPDKGDVISISENLVGQIYYVGYYNDYFYAVMEFIDGITLKDFLTLNLNSKDKNMIPFGIKYNIALKLNQYHRVFLSKNIIHGDLHWKNVMITNFTQHQLYQNKFYHTYELKIIDFGTSYFSGENVSIERSFKTLIETINHCIFPFKLFDIKASTFPLDRNNYKEMSSWIEKQLFALRAAFFELEQEYVGWPLYRAYGTYEITTKGFNIETQFIKKKIEEQIKSGKIIMSREFLGESEDWDTFDGRTAIRGD